VQQSGNNLIFFFFFFFKLQKGLWNTRCYEERNPTGIYTDRDNKSNIYQTPLMKWILTSVF
jgi:hypothetical protein